MAGFVGIGQFSPISFSKVWFYPHTYLNLFHGKKHFYLTNYFNIIQWEKRHNRICRNRAIFVEHRLHVLRAAAAQREGVALVGTDLILDAADAGFRPDANVVPDKRWVNDLIKTSFVGIELQWTPVNKIMDNGINRLMGSNCSWLTSPK